MITVSEAIVVEGRYDKNTLSQIVDAPIFVTNGFSIFAEPERMAMLRAVAEKRGLIILTDSDGAGLVIRNRIKSAIDPKYLKNAYIPDIPGKEKRKTAPSKEGTLGVEGMTKEVIISALRAAGATMGEEERKMPSGPITKADLYELGLFGGESSAVSRRKLQKKLGLPEKLSANSLLEVLNILTDRQELEKLINE